MGKNSKRKKNKKADFQKVKLKVGRKLPKGNVVDTTFKAKKVVIKEQLRSNENCTKLDLSERSFQDCLRKIGHHNGTIKLETLKTLDEMLSFNPTLIQLHTHQLIEKLSQLFTDELHAVRTANIAILSKVIAKVSEEKMIPFFPILVSHLRCAATHLMHDVQKNALCIIDKLVSYYPHQIRYFSKSLLEDAVNQISNCATNSRNTSQHKLGKLPLNANKSRSSRETLNVNLSFNTTSLSWHLKQCLSIEKILSNICKNLTCDQNFPRKKINSYEWNRNEEMFVSVNNFALSPELTCERDRVTNYFENIDQLKSILERITPLLCEMWVEARSLNENIDKHLYGTCEQVGMYMCIIKIIRAVWKLSENWNQVEDFDMTTWFVKKFGNSILQHCYKDFPHLDKGKPIQRKQALGEKMSVVELNLLMCDVMFCFTPWVVTGEAQQLLNSCVAYVNNLLNEYRERRVDVKLSILLDVVKHYIDLNKNAGAIDLLNKIMSLLNFLRPGTNSFDCYTSFLEIVLKDNDRMNYDDVNFESWLNEVLNHLLRSNIVSSKLLNIIKHAAPRASFTFLNSLATVYLQLLELLPGMKVDNGQVEVAQQNIVELLYWIPKISNELLIAIAKILSDQSISIQLSLYLISIIENKIRLVIENCCRKEKINFFNFFLTVAFGCTQQKLGEINNPEQECISSKIFLDLEIFSIVMNPLQSVLHQQALTKAAINALLGISSDTELNMVSKVFFEKCFQRYKILPLKSVRSLCTTICQFWHSSGPPANIHTQLTNIFLLYFEILVADPKLSEFSLSIKEVMKVSGLSQAICNRILLHSQTTKSLNDVDIMGPMTSLVALNCQSSHAEMINQILETLKDQYDNPVCLPEWYIKAKYTLNQTLTLNKI